MTSRDSGLARKLVGARVTRSNVQSIPHNVWTAMSFDTETFDTGGFWVVGSPTRFTITEAGKYLIVTRSGFIAQGTGNRAIGIRKGGATDIASAFFNNLGATSGCDQVMSSIQYLAVGEYIEMMVSQMSGFNLDTLAGTDKPEFSIYQLAAG